MGAARKAAVAASVKEIMLGAGPVSVGAGVGYRGWTSRDRPTARKDRPGQVFDEKWYLSDGPRGVPVCVVTVL
jgi:hypothetical protein